MHYLYMKIGKEWRDVAIVDGLRFAAAVGYQGEDRAMVTKLARTISQLFERPVQIRFMNEHATGSDKLVIDEF